MVAALILLILLVLLFGGLGVFVAKIFFLALVAVLLMSLIGGGVYSRRR
jgi:hypothetical protein